MAARRKKAPEPPPPTQEDATPLIRGSISRYFERMTADELIELANLIRAIAETRQQQVKA
jgi:hypothetical protein